MEIASSTLSELGVKKTEFVGMSQEMPGQATGPYGQVGRRAAELKGYKGSLGSESV
jgi:hypothetical protein